MAVGKDQIAEEYLHRDNSANLTFLHGVALIPVVLYAAAENWTSVKVFCCKKTDL